MVQRIPCTFHTQIVFIVNVLHYYGTFVKTENPTLPLLLLLTIIINIAVTIKLKKLYSDFTVSYSRIYII